MKAKDIKFLVLALVLIGLSSFLLSGKLEFFSALNAELPQKASSQSWKSFEGADGRFTVEYPSTWELQDKSSTQDCKSFRLSGGEGYIDLKWGDCGFGGACLPKWDKIEIRGDVFDVCHQVLDDGSEIWRDIGKILNEGAGFSADAVILPPIDSNKEVVFKILQTLHFK